MRSSLIVWGPGILKQSSHVNRDSVFSAIDLVPSILDLTGTPHPEGVTFDGKSVVDAITGEKDVSREAPIYFCRPPDRDSFYGVDDLPDLAVRSGHWKLMCEYDGSQAELYDLTKDPGETHNVVLQYSDVADQLVEDLVAWHKSMPSDNGATYRR